MITGHIARGEIRRSAGRVSGGGQATAGLVLGYLQIIATVLVVLIIIAVVLTNGSTSP